MARIKRWQAVLIGVGVVIAAVGIRVAIGFRPTNLAIQSADLGTPSRGSALEAVVDTAGPVTVETVVGAEWSVPRSGLINLDSPKAKEAHLVDGDEPIIIQFHAFRHPTRGLFLVDTGVERALREDRAHSIFGDGMLASAMHIEQLKVRTDTAGWLTHQSSPPAGVFLTHLHLDHVSGMRDVPTATPVYVGPGEPRTRMAMNLLVQGPTDLALTGKGPLRELAFKPDPDGTFDGVLDVFGDQTVWALWVPGHTAGSTAYLVRSTSGPILLTGDACHTAWGWKNHVEPGTFSEDRPQSRASLDRLEGLVARHPTIDVRLGHQALGPSR